MTIRKAILLAAVLVALPLSSKAGNSCLENGISSSKSPISSGFGAAAESLSPLTANAAAVANLPHISACDNPAAATIGPKSSAEEAARPWTFWYWMYGAVSKAGIHADLCGMKDIGLGGCYLMFIRSPKDKPEFHGTATQLSPTFWSMVDYAFAQADSLGLNMGIHVSDGFALAGFPTITPAESMQKVVWTDTVITRRDYRRYLRSHKTIADYPVDKPESYRGYYEDIARIAIPCNEIPRRWTPDSIILSPEISSKKGYWLASRPANIIYSFASPVTVRSMIVEPEGNNVQSERLLVEASADGISYHRVRQLVPPRQGWQNTGSAYTFALPPTKARFFRFSWTPAGTEPGCEDLDAAKWKPLLKLRNIVLSNELRIDNYEAKSGIVWRVPSDSLLPPAAIDASDVPTDRSPYVRILRIGHTSTGQMNATAGGGKGLEVDKFSVGATKKLLDGWFLRFAARPHASVVKYLHVDSWECGAQNWGENFADEFRQRRGYDLTPYLPVLCGYTVESPVKSEQVLRDVRRTINDLVNDKFFATVSAVAHDHGMLVSHESIAPTFPADGIEHYRLSDIPMGEFWLRSPTHDKPCDMLDAVSGAHVYGKNIVQAEGFTEVRGTWDETPAMIKPLLDRNFCLGMNRLFFHVDAHEPCPGRRPGMTLDGIGLFFQRGNTWYGESKALVDYIRRCQTELQKGTPVVDVAVFTGEEIPSRSVTPDRLVPMFPGLFGPRRVESERIRLANVGQPLEESPVGVTHSANIFSLDGWSNALGGYKYDCVGPDALLSPAFRSGRCPAYKVLVVPRQYAPGVKAAPLSAAVSARIDSLRRSGMTVITEPYAGRDFSEYGLQPDIVLPDSMDYAHRHTDSCEIFFISNQAPRPRTVTVSFRGSYISATIMNPVDGRSEPLRLSAAPDGRTAARLSLSAYGSAIIRLSCDSAVVAPLRPKKEHTVVMRCGRGSRIIYDESGISRPLPVGEPLRIDWSVSPDDSIAYYSGHATIETTVDVSEHFDGCTLMLGDVRDVAHVFVNGTDCGIAWTPPYAVDITPALHRGRNKVRIVVVNTWHNALLGADKGRAPFTGIWTNGRYRTKSDRLLPAGLLSPVEMNFWKYKDE